MLSAKWQSSCLETERLLVKMQFLPLGAGLFSLLLTFQKSVLKTGFTDEHQHLFIALDDGCAAWCLTSTLWAVNLLVCYSLTRVARCDVEQAVSCNIEPQG